MLAQEFVLAHGCAVAALQAGKDQRRRDGQSSQPPEREMNAVDHLRRHTHGTAGHKERRRKSGRRHAKADRHLLHGARDRTGTARILLVDGGILRQECCLSTSA